MRWSVQHQFIFFKILYGKCGEKNNMIYDLDNATTRIKIGERIREERIAARFSQMSFAVAVGLKEDSRQSVIKWENGHLPSLKVLIKMCEIFDCEIGYLLCEFDGKTKVKTDIQAETGLSDKSVERLIAPEYMGEMPLNLMDLILGNDKFWFALEELFPLYFSMRNDPNSSAREFGMIKFSVNNIFGDLIDEICIYEREHNPQEPLKKMTVKTLEKTGMKITKNSKCKKNTDQA